MDPEIASPTPPVSILMSLPSSSSGNDGETKVESHVHVQSTAITDDIDHAYDAKSPIIITATLSPTKTINITSRAAVVSSSSELDYFLSCHFQSCYDRVLDFESLRYLKVTKKWNIAALLFGQMVPVPLSGNYYLDIDVVLCACISYILLILLIVVIE